jgi:hypothetical protein
MSNSARLALGTVVKRGDGNTPEVFTSIGECIQTPEIGVENPLVDVTYSDATAREYIAGIPEGMELEYACNYNSANTQHSGIISDVNAKVNRNWQTTVPAASTKTLAYTMTMLKWAIETMFDKQLILHFAGKVSGSIVIS